MSYLTTAQTLTRTPSRPPVRTPARSLLRLTLAFTLAFALAFALPLLAAGKAAAVEKFESVSVRMEQNLADRDGEVVFEATSGAAGLLELQVVAPDGRVVIDFKAPQTRLGIRHLKLESPEPRDLVALRGDFPAGDYTFTGRTAAGTPLGGVATLSHRLPGAVWGVRPRPDALNVSLKRLVIQWVADTNLASCLVSIEAERTGAMLVQASLPGTATRFVVPDAVLLPGTRYKVSIGAVQANGNGAFVESTFTTALK